MEIKDLAGLSEPLSKLVEVCSKGCGVLYKPRETVNNAKAEAEAKVISAKAEAEVIGILSEAIRENKELMKIGYNNGPLLMALDEKQIAERVFQRLGYQEMKRQINSEAIIQIAASNLMKESTVSSDPVDEDWIASFFDMAQNISNEQMQILWGKILAGEIKKPQTYSLRTLHFLKMVSKDEAMLFSRISPYVINLAKNPFLLDSKTMNQFGFDFSDILLLEELGLVMATPGLSMSYHNIYESDMTKDVRLLCNGYLVIARNWKVKEATISTINLTDIGAQILSLVTPESAPIEYVIELGNLLKQSFSKVSYNKIVKDLGNGQLHVEAEKEL